MKFRWVLAVAATVGGLMAVAPESGRAQEQLDLTAIVPCVVPGDEAHARCETARALLVQHCSTCHLFLRAARKRTDEQGWIAIMNRMRPRVPNMTDEQARVMLAYMIETLKPGLPQPVLPEYLRELE